MIRLLLGVLLAAAMAGCASSGVEAKRDTTKPGTVQRGTPVHLHSGGAAHGGTHGGGMHGGMH